VDCQLSPGRAAVREHNHGWRCGNVALSQAILGSKFWALGGRNQKSKENVLESATWRDDSQKMARFHQKKKTEKKNRFEGAA